jgi:hypothetical protein
MLNVLSPINCVANGSATLFPDPLAVPRDRRVCAQRFECGKTCRERHLVVQAMNTLVTQCANPDAGLQLFARPALAEPVTAMNLAWHEVVKRQ